ncbi:MAG TPA: antibiotic biosynthesis monooxygenase, partial [Terriglobia bacterium]|nr:antibiotic biosynthesis monooxygenase [Terriglobia bacterium]
DECITMILWDTPEHAESYEQHGLFQRLLRQAEHFFANSLEWRIQLSKDVSLDHAPIQDEPVIPSHSVGATTLDPARPTENPRLYVRILSIQLEPGMMEEFARLYNELIIPTLRSVAGCRYAFLTEGMEERNEVMSVTIWDTKHDADTYEANGIFSRLKEKVRHTYSEIYQWKLAAERTSHARPTHTRVESAGHTTVVGSRVLS